MSLLSPESFVSLSSTDFTQSLTTVSDTVITSLCSSPLPSYNNKAIVPHNFFIRIKKLSLLSFLPSYLCALFILYITREDVSQHLSVLGALVPLYL